MISLMVVARETAMKMERSGLMSKIEMTRETKLKEFRAGDINLKAISI